MMQRIRDNQQLLTLLLVSAIWFLIGWVVRSQTLAPVTAVTHAVNQYIDRAYPFQTPDDVALAGAAAAGMVSALGDPHAGYLDAEQVARFQADYSGQTGMVGLLPELVAGQWQVAVVLPDGPAAKAGLRVGDVLLKIDGRTMTPDLTAIAVTLLLRGPVNQPATFEVARDGEILTFTPIRTLRVVVSPSQMLDDNIGYFAQYTFTDNAPAEVEAVLQTLLAQQPQAIIWDLRSNGGGSMRAAEEILDNFLSEGVLYQAALHGDERREVLATSGGMATAVPLVLLVSDRTYSSAETVTLSLQEHQRAIIVGTTTHGKGTIQDVLPLPGGAGLQMTVARWLSPSGVWVDGVGVTPDVVVVDDPETEQDEVLAAAVALIMNGERP